MDKNKNEPVILDLAGIGVGPFNLSVAALVQQKEDLKTCFFEGRDSFAWHPGLLLDDTHMQTMFLKDLVTSVAPHSIYSFLSYLVDRKKMYRFLSAELTCISRHEFSDYLSWAAKKLPNVQFSSKVEAITFNDGLFEITTNQGQYKAKNLCLGTGKVPHIPECAVPFLGPKVIHAAEIGLQKRDFTGKRVVVVGGGQSGADIFLNSLRGAWGKPAQLDWLSRRANYQPLDEAAFTNEFFTPEYVNAFYELDDEVREKEIAAQKLTSDGITQIALLTIYREMYHRFDVLGEKPWVNLLPHRNMTDMQSLNGGFNIIAENALSNNEEQYPADIVILATGFESSLAKCLDGLKEQLNLDEQGRFRLSTNFSLDWQGDPQNKIFAVNAGMHSHGIAEPQLSLMAWRSAKIINHLCGHEFFDLSAEKGMINWIQTDSPVKQLLDVA